MMMMAMTMMMRMMMMLTMMLNRSRLTRRWFLSVSWMYAISIWTEGSCLCLWVWLLVHAQCVGVYDLFQFYVCMWELHDLFCSLLSNLIVQLHFWYCVWILCLLLCIHDCLYDRCFVCCVCFFAFRFALSIVMALLCVCVSTRWLMCSLSITLRSLIFEYVARFWFWMSCYVFNRSRA